MAEIGSVIFKRTGNTWCTVSTEGNQIIRTPCANESFFDMLAMGRATFVMLFNENPFMPAYHCFTGTMSYQGLIKHPPRGIYTVTETNQLKDEFTLSFFYSFLKNFKPRFKNFHWRVYLPPINEKLPDFDPF